MTRKSGTHHVFFFPTAIKRGASLFLLLLAGCMAGPDYRKPDAPRSAEFKETPAPWKQAQPRDDIAKGKWWEMFGDPLLTAMVEKIEKSNQTLAASEAQYRQALAGTRIARAGLFPEVDAQVSAVRSQSPSGVLGGTTAGRTITQHSASLNVSNWEIDLWGHVRRQVEAAESTARASAADYASAKLSLQAQLATDYFQLRVLDVQKQLLDDTLEALRKSLELTQNRYNVGVAAKADVVQADAQVKSVQVQATDVGVQRAQLEHAIAVLTGVTPAELAIAPLPRYAMNVPVIPPGIASELLERRPDVAAAERRVQAANAQVGATAAAFFPAVTLSASLGYRSSDTSTWFTAPSRFWSLGPSVVMALFDAGLRRAQNEQAIAAYDATVANYRGTALTAFQEVEDNLAALRILDEEAQAEADAVAAARQSVDLTLNQYKAGVASFLNVVTVTTALLSEERNAIGIQGRRMAAAVALVRALGGGWQQSEAPPGR
ncbi:MAG TPA: efflux transporter outer membrane subunit [Burkholderiales bacterium]|nr:efflux transporter outer membrane subunit [Burkholderiales bacterium]